MDCVEIATLGQEELTATLWLIQYGPRRRSAASQEKDFITEMFSLEETMSCSCVQVKIIHI